MSLPARVPADVIVWLIDIDLAAPFAPANTGLLTAEELHRARRFVRHADAARFVAVRVALRHVLSTRLDLPPESLIIDTDARGRPMLSRPAAPDFNVSHSGAYGAIVLSVSRRVGIDIEEAEASVNWRELAPDVLTEFDRDVLEALPEMERHSAFFDCWTAKEAVLKAHGTGFGEGAVEMDAFSVLPRRGVSYSLSPEAGPFEAVALDAPAHYSAALAWAHGLTP